MKKISLKFIGFALAAVAACGAVQAQSGYPTKPITLIVAFAAGGDSDLSGRNLARHAQKYLNNQPVAVVNRVGASGRIGSMATRSASAVIASTRSAAETEQFMREQYELYERIASSMGVRQ